MPRYLTVIEVAALARCEHKAVGRAIHLGHLQAFQPAHKLLIREQDARAWIQSRPLRPAEPVAARRPRPRNGQPAAGSVEKLRELEQQLILDSIKSV